MGEAYGHGIDNDTVFYVHGAETYISKETGFGCGISVNYIPGLRLRSIKKRSSTINQSESRWSDFRSFILNVWGCLF